MELLLSLLARECSILELEQDIHERVHEQLDQNQKEYYLREQMRVISSELGEADNPHDMQIAAAKAYEALQYTVAVRDKMLDAYKEIMNMQI